MMCTRSLGVLGLLLLIAPLSPAARGETETRSAEFVLQTAKDPLVRESAAQVLGHRGGRSAVELLIRQLEKDPIQWVRARCAESLGRLGAREATSALNAALGREKERRVRRAIAFALLRLGQQAGLHEVMWQLKSGTHYVQAEVMQFLVELTGEALGENVDAWWAYFHRRGYTFLARRAAGSPSLLELSGPPALNHPDERRSPCVVASPALPNQALPMVVVQVTNKLLPISLADVKRAEHAMGKLPDGVLLMLHAVNRPTRKPAPKATDAAVAPTVDSAELLAPAALAHLLKVAPSLLGVGVDVALPVSADARPACAAPAEPWAAELTRRGKLALYGLDTRELEKLPESGARVLVVPLGAMPTPTQGQPEPVRLFALLP